MNQFQMKTKHRHNSQSLNKYYSVLDFVDTMETSVIFLIIIIYESGLEYAFCLLLCLIYAFFKTVTILLQYVNQPCIANNSINIFQLFNQILQWEKIFLQKIQFCVKTQFFLFWDLSTLPYFRHPRLQAFVNFFHRFLITKQINWSDLIS